MMLRSIRRGALIVIVLGSLYGSFQNLIATRALGSINEDPVADWEKRFGPLKKHLPIVRGAVGYVSDSSVPGAPYDPANDLGEYVLTQYVMAPIIIVKGTNQQWNIGNLSPEAYRIWDESNQGQFEVTAFYGGLYLIHRIQQ